MEKMEIHYQQGEDNYVFYFGKRKVNIGRDMDSVTAAFEILEALEFCDNEDEFE